MRSGLALNALLNGSADISRERFPCIGCGIGETLMERWSDFHVQSLAVFFYWQLLFDVMVVYTITSSGRKYKIDVMVLWAVIDSWL